MEPPSLLSLERPGVSQPPRLLQAQGQRETGTRQGAAVGTGCSSMACAAAWGPCSWGVPWPPGAGRGYPGRQCRSPYLAQPPPLTASGFAALSNNVKVVVPCVCPVLLTVPPGPRGGPCPFPACLTACALCGWCRQTHARSQPGGDLRRHCRVLGVPLPARSPMALCHLPRCRRVGRGTWVPVCPPGSAPVPAGPFARSDLL